MFPTCEKQNEKRNKANGLKTQPQWCNAVKTQAASKLIKPAVTLTSASCFSFCQFQTDRMWSLASSTAQRNAPPFWTGRWGVRRVGQVSSALTKAWACLTFDPAALWSSLTDLEKATQVTARSNTPVPMTCSVLRLTESQTRTWGARSWTGQTQTLC